MSKIFFIGDIFYHLIKFAKVTFKHFSLNKSAKAKLKVGSIAPEAKQKAFIKIPTINKADSVYIISVRRFTIFAS